MLDWGVAEFFGIMFFLPLLAYLTFAVFDGFGILRDVFMTSNRKPR
jgi:hypothetical protein